MNNKTEDNLPIRVALLGILGTGGYLAYNWFNKNKAGADPLPPVKPEEGETPEAGASRQYDRLLEDLQSRQGDQWRIAETDFIARASGLTDASEVYDIYHEIYHATIGLTKFSSYCSICEKSFKAETKEVAKALKDAHVRSSHPLPTKEQIEVSNDGWFLDAARKTIHEYKGLIPEAERIELKLTVYRRLYFRAIRYLGVRWFPIADDYWLETVATTSFDLLYIMYLQKLLAGPPPPELQGWPVEEQLNSCWNSIEGGGAEGEHAIWVWRGSLSRYLFYDFHDPLGSDLEEILAGDWVKLYLTMACVLSYAGKSWSLVEGWNEFQW